MKRDMDLARQILLDVESKTQPRRACGISIEGKTPEEVSYHIMILDQAGLLEGKNASTSGRFQWLVLDLTFWGHEFLDASRETELWEKAKKLAVEKAGSFSFEAIKEALLYLTKTAMGIP